MTDGHSFLKESNARGQRGEVVGAEKALELCNVHHGDLLRRDEGRGLFRRDGAGRDGMGVVHSLSDIFVRPPVEGKIYFMMQRNVVDVGNHNVRGVVRRHGMRVGQRQSTEDRTHGFGLLSLARGALCLAFVFVRLARLLDLHALGAEEEDHVLGEWADGSDDVPVRDHETLVCVGILVIWYEGFADVFVRDAGRGILCLEIGACQLKASFILPLSSQVIRIDVVELKKRGRGNVCRARHVSDEVEVHGKGQGNAGTGLSCHGSDEWLSKKGAGTKEKTREEVFHSEDATWREKDEPMWLCG
ncbi:hypothetical protein B0H11DRAFT_1901266 [Mycena galericulata]|nr:hypothetical protein B0H11DRAFT_1901266 [Mycena galericulata]